MNGMMEDKPLSVPRDINLQLDTSPITAVDALGNALCPQDATRGPPGVSPGR